MNRLEGQIFRILTEYAQTGSMVEVEPVDGDVSAVVNENAGMIPFTVTQDQHISRRGFTLERIVQSDQTRW